MNQLPALGPNRNDRSAAVLKSLAGAVPWAGAALTEVINEIIPNQRIERIEKYLMYLAEELDKRKSETLAEELKKPENVDLFEEGAYQAVRALSDERKLYIARCVAQGIADIEQLEKKREKRVLRLLGELDDEEILLLKAFSEHNSDIFSQLRPQPAVIGAPSEVIYNEALYKSGINNLERLGLITGRYRTPKKGELPEFDDRTGKLKGSPSSVSSLGRLVLESIGLLENPN